MTLTHGLSKTHPAYERWQGMRARCNYPNHISYARYGGRGIRVCERWDDFTLFLEDMGWPGEGFELHRIYHDGDYAPENCVWLPIAVHRGFPKSADHRAKIGAAHKGRKHSPEQIAAQAESQRIKIDPAWLREAFVDRGLSVYAIADELGCGKSSVHRALQRAGISRS